MSWVAVGVGAAVGAAGGAIYGSQKGGDDVWKGALIGGLGGATLGGGAEAAFGAGTALQGAFAAPTVAEVAAPVVAEGVAGSAGVASLPGAGAFGGAGGASVGGIGGLAPEAGIISSGQLAGAGGGSAFGTTGGTSLLGSGAGVIPGVTPTAAAPVTSMAPTVASTAPTVSAVPAVAPAAPSAAPSVAPTTTKAAPSFLTEYGKPIAMGALSMGLGSTLLNNNSGVPTTEEYNGPLSEITYDPDTFEPTVVQSNVYKKKYAEGGIAGLAGGGDPMNPIANSVYPQSQQMNTAFATSPQMPNSMHAAMASDYDARTNPTSGAELPMGMAQGGMAGLGYYSDGGQMLKGPGDGMSDSIPGTISGKQPARLADGEFVVPADVVSHLGNGSTDAGAKQLYSMMNKVRKARTGNPKQGKQINPKKYMPA